MRLNVQIVKRSDSGGSEGANGLILTFKDYKNTVELESYIGEEEETVVIAFVKNTNPEFLIDGGEDDNSIFLAKIWDPEAFKKLFDLNCGYEKGDTPLECTFNENSEEINVDKGSGDEFEELTIEDTKGKSFEIHAEEEGFNQGYKFVFKGETVPGSEGAGLESGSSYELKWKSEKGKPREYYLAKKSSQ